MPIEIISEEEPLPNDIIYDSDTDTYHNESFTIYEPTTEDELLYIIRQQNRTIRELRSLIQYYNDVLVAEGINLL